MIDLESARQLAREGQDIANAATKGKWRSTWDEPHHETFDESAAVATDLEDAPLGGMVVGTIWYDGLHVACKREDSIFIADAHQRGPDMAKQILSMADEIDRLDAFVADHVRRQYLDTSELIAATEAVAGAFRIAGLALPDLPLIKGPAVLAQNLKNAWAEVDRLELVAQDYARLQQRWK